MSQDLTGDKHKLALVQVMAWCRLRESTYSTRLSCPVGGWGVGAGGFGTDAAVGAGRSNLDTRVLIWAWLDWASGRI